MVNLKLVISLFIMATLFGCSSTRLRSKTKQRDRIAQDKSFYCANVNSDEAESVEIELNLQMAEKCDTSKPFSTSHYKNDSGESQVIYCCSVVPGALKVRVEKPKKKKKKKKSKKSSSSSDTPESSSSEDK